MRFYSNGYGSSVAGTSFWTWLGGCNHFNHFDDSFGNFSCSRKEKEWASKVLSGYT